MEHRNPCTTSRARRGDDSAGKVVWNRPLEGGHAVAARPDGVIIAGSVSRVAGAPFSTERDLLIEKRDDRGNQLWTRRYRLDGPNLYVAADATAKGFVVAAAASGLVEIGAFRATAKTMVDRRCREDVVLRWRTTGDSSTQGNTSVLSQHIYKCVDLIRGPINTAVGVDAGDWAVFQVDRDVTGGGSTGGPFTEPREPLILETVLPSLPQSNSVLIGTPSGTPIKVDPQVVIDVLPQLSDKTGLPVPGTFAFQGYFDGQSDSTLVEGTGPSFVRTDYDRFTVKDFNDDGIDDLEAGVGNTVSDAYLGGVNLSGQLGDGTTATRLSPVPLPNLGGIAAVSAGESHTCAASTDGTLASWGSNAQHQLGTSTGSTSTPTSLCSP